MKAFERVAVPPVVVMDTSTAPETSEAGVTQVSVVLPFDGLPQLAAVAPK